MPTGFGLFMLNDSDAGGSRTVGMVSVWWDIECPNGVNCGESSSGILFADCKLLASLKELSGWKGCGLYDREISSWRGK